MSGTESQKVASPPSVHFSWSSKEGDATRESGRSEPTTPIISISSQPAGLKQAQALTIRKENLLMDELPFVLEAAELNLLAKDTIYRLTLSSLSYAIGIFEPIISLMKPT